jgi:hypothetical protein
MSPRIAEYTPLSTREKVLLYNKMFYGKTFRNRYPFQDCRHKTIYTHLDYLQEQTFAPGTKLLVLYLKECKTLDQAGGVDYVRSIFHGLEPGDVL